jgi:hypothetical protein
MVDVSKYDEDNLNLEDDLKGREDGSDEGVYLTYYSINKSLDPRLRKTVEMGFQKLIARGLVQMIWLPDSDDPIYAVTPVGLLAGI